MWQRRGRPQIPSFQGVLKNFLMLVELDNGENLFSVRDNKHLK